jgi:hypothetical protein
MGDSFSVDYYKLAFLTMRKGESAFIRVGKDYHKGVYFKGSQYMGKTEEEKAVIGSDIYIRLTITNVKRNPVCVDPNTLDGKLAYYSKISPLCKSLLEEGEFINA